MLSNLLSNSLLDLRSALRSLRRHPVFAGVAVLTLALAIGANTAMFATIHAAALRPLPYREPGRLVLASATFGGYPNPMASAPDYYDYREQADSFEALGAMMSFVVKTTVTGRERPERVATILISDDFFGMLGVRPVAGRWFTPEEGKPGGPRVLIIGEHFARRWFGSARDAVGRPLTVNGTPLTVVGVMPAGFRLFHDVDVWVPMRRGESVAGAPRRFHNWLIVGRLKAGVSIERAQRQVDVISKRLEQQYPDSNRNKALGLSSLQTAIVGRQMPMLAALMAAVGLVLLIACGNVAGLLLARGAARRPELALRSALGVSRSRLVGQLVIESLVLAVAAGVIGVLLAYWLQGLMPIVAGLQQTGITIEGLSWSVLLFALGLSVVTGLLFGVVPALRTSALNVSQELAPGARATDTRGGTRLRSVLVAGQVAVSLMLLITAGLLIRSFVRLTTTDPGFVIEHLLTGEIQLLPNQYPEESRQIQFFDGLREDLLAVPGVTAVGFTSHLPIKNPAGNVPVWAADNAPANPADRPSADRRIVLPGYFDAVRIPLVSGRDLSARDRSGAPVALVVSQLMARTLFPGRSPLGQRVMVDNGGDQPVATEVVGVVGDARVNAIGQPPRMTMYLSYYQFPDFTLRFAIRTAADPDSMVGTVRKLVAARDKEIPVENLVSMEQLIGDSVAPRRVTTITLGLFSLVAMLLASIGLYGVLAYYVNQRTHEIGVRMSLGADVRRVVGHVLWRSALMVVPGIAVGLAAAFAGGRVLQQLLFEVPPTDPATYAAVSACLAGVALIASVVPAWRAARIDPVTALRSE
jgi:putative ABC transport system permease protein